MYFDSKCEDKNVAVASVNFIDMRSNSGPSINELEFNRWLLANEENAFVITPHRTNRLGENLKERIITFGNHSLRRPIRSLCLSQYRIAKLLSKVMIDGGIVYYRHSRLAIVALVLKKLRPDIHLVTTRMHPSGSDTGIKARGINRKLSKLIDRFDSVLRKKIVKASFWVDCVTETQAERLRGETGRSIQVVMNAVNTALFRPLDRCRRTEIKRRLNIPDDAIVVGYCGGFPMQRGALEVSNLVKHDNKFYGVVAGKISEQDLNIVMHKRMRILGEVPYHEVPELTGIFDIAVALDLPGRSAVVGNSNQKVRQGLACGAWILTESSDLPFDEKPFLGKNIDSRSPEFLSKIIESQMGNVRRRDDRIDYAISNLSIESIFKARHAAVMSGVTLC